MMYRVQLKQPVAGLAIGQKVVIDSTGAGFHIWDKCILRRFVEAKWDDFEIQGYASEDEKPGYLYPYFVPGFVYHGHHLYLDDIWLDCRGNLEILKKITNLCGVNLTDFHYPQLFCKWFKSRYPDGIFLKDLEMEAQNV